MNAALKSLLFSSVIVSLLGLTTVAHAAPPHIQLRLYPGSGPSVMPLVPETPRLGFYGHFEWGYGMVVDSVPWGTPAKRMGLESGDVIRAINGQWLRSQADYYRAMQYSGGYVQVTVQDVRTGILATRVATIGGGYYAAPAGYSSGPSLSLEY